MKENFEKFLEKDSIIVFDTNVFLNLYEYSPEVADAFIEAIYFIKEKVYIPSTVKREFLRNHRECSGRQKKKFKNVSKELKKYTEKASLQLNKQLNILEKFQFPKIQELRSKSLEKLTEVENIFDKYLNEYDIYEEINKKFLMQDKILELFNEILKSGRGFDELTVEELYNICSEGKSRYYKLIPPGFEDAKTKDGIDKYNDLILWKEVLKYCKENQHNLIFVTDDVKKDWWKTEGENKTFHISLIDEFETFTQKEILPLNSQTLYDVLGKIYDISTPDTIQNVLLYSIDKYIETLIEDYDLIDDIQSTIVNSSNDYINIDSLSYYDGSYFEMNDEFDNITLKNCTLEEYSDGIAVYETIFDATITAKSRCYCGRDDDSNDIVLSPNYYIHKLSGEIYVKITRKIDNNYIGEFMDDILEDYTFLNVEIVSADLDEIDVIDSEELCVQCHKNIGTVFYGDNGDMVCNECAVQDEKGEICPGCGKKKPFSAMAGNGFCIECTSKSDYL